MMRTHASVYRQLILDQAVRDETDSTSREMVKHAYSHHLPLDGYVCRVSEAIRTRFKELMNA